MMQDLSTVLLGREAISTRVSELGAAISQDFAGKSPLMVGVLKGSFVFMADLIRSITIPCELEFMAVSSYGKSSKSTGEVRIERDLAIDIRGRDVIVVEDILDSGMTLSFLVKYLWSRQPASVTLVALLDKPERRQADVTADYVGFEIPDEFVVGYGLDFAEKYRNLPFIAALKPEVYAPEFSE